MTPELGMQSTALKEKPEGCQIEIRQKNFGWVDNPDVQRLLDVVSSIMAEEYIHIAKENPEVFMDSRFRGNDRKEGGNSKNGGGK